METESKTARTRSSTRGKNLASSTEPLPNSTQKFEETFVSWMKTAKSSKEFPFLDNYFQREFLRKELRKGVSSHLEEEELTSSALKDAMRFSGLIRYIEKYSNSEELENLLHNIVEIYGVNKETLKKEVRATKKKVRKAPENMLIELYLESLIEDDSKRSKDDIHIEELLANATVKTVTRMKKAEPITTNGDMETEDEVKEIPRRSDWVDKKRNKKLNLKEAATKHTLILVKLEEGTEKPIEDLHPIRKKVKDNSSTGREANGLKPEEGKIVDPEKVLKKKDNKIVEENGKVHKERKKKLAKKDDNSKDTSENEEEVKEPVDERYMELHINNEVDSDDGEGFCFFFVNENVYNKTEHYFEKKPSTGEVCSCVGGCNDPTVCPCARYNFEHCGKTACYVYDPKIGQKRLINPLIRKDTHIYECSAECGCNKSLCFNSCVNEGEINKCSPNDFVIERYYKMYTGNSSKLRDYGAKMWGLKTRVFIPANTYVVEYCGEIITKKEGDRRGEKYDSVNCNYLFDLNKHAEIEKSDKENNMIILNIDGVCETRKSNQIKDIRKNFPLVIDAFFYGNHSRFVNHSCDPNMVAIAVHTENRDILLPRIIYFALRDIQPGEELTIDYNCAPLKDLKNTDQLVCLCGAAICRGFVYEEAEDEA